MAVDIYIYVETYLTRLLTESFDIGICSSCEIFDAKKQNIWQRTNTGICPRLYFLYGQSFLVLARF